MLAFESSFWLSTALLPAAWASADRRRAARGSLGRRDPRGRSTDVALSVDLAADDAGKLGGTFSSPSQRVQRLAAVGARASTVES